MCQLMCSNVTWLFSTVQTTYLDAFYTSIVALQEVGGGRGPWIGAIMPQYWGLFSSDTLLFRRVSCGLGILSYRNRRCSGQGCVCISKQPVEPSLWQGCVCISKQPVQPPLWQGCVCSSKQPVEPSLWQGCVCISKQPVQPPLCGQKRFSHHRRPVHLQSPGHVSVHRPMCAEAWNMQTEFHWYSVEV